MFLRLRMISLIKLKVNGCERKISVAPDTPLLWVLRDHLGLTGTKYGCGISVCGVCTVHVDGKAIHSCSIPVSAAQGSDILTIEGLSNSISRSLQHAWLVEQVIQCGYCQPGQIMTAVALLQDKSAPSDADIEDAMSSVLCRCGTYQRIRRAIKLAISMHQS